MEQLERKQSKQVCFLTDFSNLIRSTGPSTSMHQSAIRLSLVGLRTSFYTCQRSDCKTLLNTLSKRSVNRFKTVKGFSLVLDYLRQLCTTGSNFIVFFALPKSSFCDVRYSTQNHFTYEKNLTY